MGKKIIKKIETEKFLELFEEVYNEIQDERSRGMLAYKKIYAKMKDTTDMMQLGKTANDFLKIVDSAHDKKIKLLRLYTEMIKANPDMATKSATNKAANLNDINSTEDLAKLAKELGIDVDMAERLLNNEYTKK